MKNSNLKTKIIGTLISFVILAGCLFLVLPFIQMIQCSVELDKIAKRSSNIQLAVSDTRSQAKAVGEAVDLWNTKEGKTQKALARCFYYKKKGDFVEQRYGDSLFENKWEYIYDYRWQETYTIEQSGEYGICYLQCNPVPNLKLGFQITDMNSGELLYAGIIPSDNDYEVFCCNFSEGMNLDVQYLYLFNEELYNQFIEDNDIVSEPMSYPMDDDYAIAEAVGLVKMK